MRCTFRPIVSARLSRGTPTNHTQNAAAPKWFFSYTFQIDRYITRLLRFPSDWTRNADSFVFSLSLSPAAYILTAALCSFWRCFVMLSTIQRARTHIRQTFGERTAGASAKKLEPTSRNAGSLACCVIVFVVCVYLYYCCIIVVGLSAFLPRILP